MIDIAEKIDCRVCCNVTLLIRSLFVRKMSTFLLIICNNTAKDIDCSWVRPDGQEIYYATLASSTIYRVYTFESHVWKFTCTSSKSTIRSFTVNKEPFGQIVDVVDLPEAPEDLTCDISYTLMNDPVKASDGHVYDLFTLHKIFQSDGLSPFTRKKLSRKLILEKDILAACARFCQEHDCIYLRRESLYSELGLCEPFRIVDTSQSWTDLILEKPSIAWFWSF